MDVVRSVNGVPIRLTEERWNHIEEWHEDLLGLKVAVLATVSDPYVVVEGAAGECRAIRRLRNAWLVVP